jgi:hypothetical protein
VLRARGQCLVALRSLSALTTNTCTPLKRLAALEEPRVLPAPRLSPASSLPHPPAKTAGLAIRRPMIRTTTGTRTTLRPARTPGGPLPGEMPTATTGPPATRSITTAGTTISAGSGPTAGRQEGMQRSSQGRRATAAAPTPTSLQQGGTTAPRTRSQPQPQGTTTATTAIRQARQPQPRHGTRRLARRSPQPSPQRRRP